MLKKKMLTWWVLALLIEESDACVTQSEISLVNSIQSTFGVRQVVHELIEESHPGVTPRRCHC